MAEIRRNPTEPPDHGAPAPLARAAIDDPVEGWDPLPDPAGAQVTQPLQERLRFARARDLLAGLAGCTPERAARTLLTAATDLDLDAGRVAEGFLRCVDGAVDRDGQAAALLARLTEAAAPAAVDRDQLAPTEDIRGKHPGADPSGPSPPPAPSPDGTDLDEPTSGVAGADQVGDNHLLEQPPMFRVATSVVGERPRVVVHGELDLESAPRLRAAANTRSSARADHPGPVGFVLDLAAVTFLDLAGLDALGSIHAELTDQGKLVHIVAPAARGPRRLLMLAIDRGWLDPAFTPDDPADHHHHRA